MSQNCSLVVAFLCFTLPGALSQTAPRTPGYFDPKALPDLRSVVPPAPIDGDDRDRTDRMLFQKTRSLDGSPRWKLANEDNDLSVVGLLRAYSCATGTMLIEEDVPRLAKLLARISTDSNGITNTAKDRYMRKRPFLVQEGPICVDRTPSLLNSFDYPSGHTTLGWLTGLVLAEVLPDRATPILIRARSFGESRLICGVHNASAVESGRTLGAAIFASLSSRKDFRDDMGGVRKEMASLMRKRKSTMTLCGRESELVEPSPYLLPATR